MKDNDDLLLMLAALHNQTALMDAEYGIHLTQDGVSVESYGGKTTEMNLRTAWLNLAQRVDINRASLRIEIFEWLN